MKTLKLSTAKRLQEHLKDVEVEYYYATAVWKSAILVQSTTHRRMVNRKLVKTCFYKTLTLEEAIDFLPRFVNWWYLTLTCIWKSKKKWWVIFYKDYRTNLLTVKDIFWETPLIAIEKAINGLLDNNLIYYERHN